MILELGVTVNFGLFCRHFVKWLELGALWLSAYVRVHALVFAL